MSRVAQTFTLLLVSGISIMASAQSQSFYWQTYQPDMDSKLFDGCGSTCPDIQYELVNTYNPWLDTLLSKAVVNAIATDSEDATLKAKYTKFNALKSPTQAQYAEQLATSIKALITENKDLIANRGKDWDASSQALVQTWAKPQYMGHKNLANTTLELIQLGTYHYSGGAHGLANQDYYVFDMTKQKRLTPNDILLPNKKAQLEMLVKAQFIDWIKQNDQDPIEYQKTWQFKLTDNFTFDKNGVTFIYQPYEISPYAYGMPKFTVPYAALKGIVKSDYLK